MGQVPVLSKASPLTASAVRVVIHGAPTWALVDTGADFTMMRRGFYEGNPALRAIRLSPSARNAIGAGGTSLQVVGELENLSLCIDGVSFRCPVVTVADDLVYDVILGRDFTCMHRTVIDDDDGSFKIGTMSVPLPSREQVRPRRARVRLLSNVVIPARSESVVAGKLERVDGVQSDEMGAAGIFEPSTVAEREGLLTPRALVVADDDGCVSIILTNVGSEEVRVLRGSDLGTFYDATNEKDCEYKLCLAADGGVEDSDDDDVDDVSCRTERRQNTTVTEVLDVDGSDFSAEGKEKLRTILSEYADIFSQYAGDIGKTDLLEHHIDTGEEAPVKQRPRRVPVKLREQVEMQKTQMMKDGIIEESTSPWCSPVVLARKKDGSFRFCVDLRAINSRTRGCAHPLPRVDEALDTLAGATWYTTLDMATGYWQVPLATEDREKTAFSTGKGLHQFRVMAMGLKNAGATFQRLMELVLAGLDSKRCLVYLDDIIISSRSEDEHIATLRDVFKRVRSAKLKLKPEKCRLAKREVTFLGHRVAKEGLLPDPHNIQKILDWAPPKTEDGMKSFLGLCGYYSRFVPQYMDLTKPLREAKVVGDHLTWTPEAEAAFESLKQALTAPPVLALPTFRGTFVLYTDASDSAVGSVLAERVGDTERVIAYDSKVLTKQQRRWPTYDKELWAIVHAIRRFNQYTVGAEFEVVTDHKPLTGVPESINVERDGTGRRGRWAIELSSYQFRVVVRPGRDHGNADAMSRQRPVNGNIWTGKRSKSYPAEAGQAPVHTAATRAQEPASGGEEECVGKTRGAAELDQVCALPTAPPSAKGDQAGRLITEAPGQSELQTAQQEDEVLSVMRNACLGSREPPPDHPLAEWELLRGSWTQLEVREGVLGMRTKWGFRALVPDSMRSRIMTLAHDHPTSAHLGRSRTTERVRQRFLWPGMFADIRRYCSTCDLCQRRHRPAPKKRAPLVTEVTSQPFRRIAIDITEMPVSENGNRYAVVIMDYFSKYVRVYPVRRQDAETVTTVLLDWVYDMGVPDRIHSDQGGQFESALFQCMCKRLGIQKTRTTPYHPESDGMVERFMRTLKDMVAKYVDPQGANWDADIKAYCMAYNTSVHSVTGYSPFFLLHGFHPKTPLDAVINPPDRAVNIRCYLEERLKAISEAYQTTIRKTRASATEAATRFNQRASGKGFEAGDRVWIRDNRVSVGGKPKLGLYYKGPGTIIGRLGGERGVTYLVRDDKGKEKALHFNQLKPAVERESHKQETSGSTRRDDASDTATETRPRKQTGSEETGPDPLALYYLCRRARDQVGNGGTSVRGAYVTRSGRVSLPPDRFQS